jgi:nucleoside-diphosphate-sugar epimerase
MNILIIGGSGYLGAGISHACERRGQTVLALSRRGTGSFGVPVAGDVRSPELGLPATVLDHLRGTVTHAVLAFGSVAWTCGPSEAVDLHDTAMRNVVRFLRSLPILRRVVHISSLLVLGRASGRLTNRELYVGQTFRNWYEYGKYCAERHIRDATDLPSRTVRFGPLLGSDVRGLPLDTTTGLPAVFPHLLAGYPVHLAGRGDFPCYVGDLSSAADVVVRALTEPGDGQTWSWFDPRMPTLAEVFREVCRPWGIVPRIVDARPWDRLSRLIGNRIGVVPEIADYAEPWFDLDPRVLDEIPGTRPQPEPDYLAATGRMLLHTGSATGHHTTEASR